MGFRDRSQFHLHAYICTDPCALVSLLGAHHVHSRGTAHPEEVEWVLAHAIPAGRRARRHEPSESSGRHRLGLWLRVFLVIGSLTYKVGCAERSEAHGAQRAQCAQIDRSGDYVYQSADIGSLVLVCRLLWCVNKTYQTTYDKEHDTMEVWKAVPAAIIAGSLVHGHMNQSWFFDSTWTIGMHLDTIAMLPQYWLFVQKGGEVDVRSAARCYFARSCWIREG